MTFQNKRLLWIFMGIILVLLIPFMVMQFSDEVNWSGNDFLVIGLLLAFLGLCVEFILRKLKTPLQRLLAIIIVLFLFLLIWVELAVGLFHSPFAGS